MALHGTDVHGPEAAKAFDEARLLVGANCDAMVPGYCGKGLTRLTCQGASPHVSQVSKDVKSNFQTTY